MMDDRQIMENLLLCVKGECDLMMHGALESSTADVHSAFTQAMGDTLKMQNDIYTKMSEKGWYPATKADQQQISAVKQKFSAQ